MKSDWLFSSLGTRKILIFTREIKKSDWCIANLFNTGLKLNEMIIYLKRKRKKIYIKKYLCRKKM